MILDWNKFLIPYEQAVEELKVKFKSIRNEYRKVGEYSPIEFVTGRIKAISSILDKTERLNIPMDRVEEMEDIAGIRIMCQLVDDIQKVKEHIRNRDGKDLKIIHEKDYITNIKESGYRSYHIIILYTVHTVMGEREILAEIQIRTLSMNFWATIEHSISYKFNREIPADIRLRLKNAAEAAFQLDKEMSEIRDEIIESQGMFNKRSHLIEAIMFKMNLLKGKNLKEKEIIDLKNEFIAIKNYGEIKELEKFSTKLDEIVK